MTRSRSIYRIMSGLLVLDVALLLGSGIPAIKNAEQGWKSVAGDITWFGFLGVAIAVIGCAVTALAGRARGRQTPA
jgi:hypothetical protein